MNCRQCGATLPPGAAACPQCGTLTSTFYSGTGTSPNEPTVSSAREPTIPANPYRPNTAYGSNLYGAGIPPNYGPPSSPNYVNNPYTVPPGHGTNPYTTPPPNLYEYRPPAPPPRNNRTPLIIGLVILAVIVVGAGILVLISQGGPSTGGSSSDNLTATATLTQNPYPPHTGNLLMADPMKDNSKGYKWDEATIGGGGTCGFVNRAYHIKPASGGLICDPEAPNLTLRNLTFEARLTQITGDEEGIVFRFDQTQGTGYFFTIDTQGSYSFYAQDGSSLPIRLILHGSNGAILKGLNQTNLLAIVVNGTQIDMYVNNQFVDKTTDDAYTVGQLGILAANNNNGTADVIASDARVWSLS